MAPPESPASGFSLAFILQLWGLVLLLGLVWSLVFASSLHQLPGPWYTKYTRIPLKLAIISGRRNPFTHELHKKYGKIVRLAPNEISAVDEDSFKRIYSFSNGFRKSRLYEDMNPFPRANIFWTCDVNSHAMRRRFYSRPFSKTMLRKEWEHIVASNCALAVQKMIEQATKEGAANILRWLTFMSSDIVATIMFGESFDQLARGEQSNLHLAVERVMKGAGMAYEMPLMKLAAKLLPVESLRVLYTSGQVLTDYGEVAVHNARNNTGQKTFFSEVLAKEGQSGLDDLEIRCEAAGEMLAGSDTTSITLTYLIWSVLSQPSLRATLEDEVARLPDEFNDAILEELPFLNAVIDETLRLYTAIPSALPRLVPPEGAVLGGYHIQKGTIVSSQAYTAHRDPENFPDPEKFDPYRWMDGGSKTKTMYYPWGAGARMCQGLNLATMTIRYATAMFFRSSPTGLQLAPSATAESMEQVDFFMVKPKSLQCEIQIAG